MNEFEKRDKERMAKQMDRQTFAEFEASRKERANDEASELVAELKEYVQRQELRVEVFHVESTITLARPGGRTLKIRVLVGEYVVTPSALIDRLLTWGNRLRKQEMMDQVLEWLWSP